MDLTSRLSTSRFFVYPCLSTMNILIAGLGLAGSTLAWVFDQLGHQVTIVDPNESSTASQVAAGLMTPITGRDLQPSWRFSEFASAARQFYSTIEEKLQTRFLYQVPVHRIFIHRQERDLFESHYQNANEQESARWSILHDSPNWTHAPFGGIIMPDAARLDVPHFIKSTRAYFENNGNIHTGYFHVDNLTKISGLYKWNDALYNCVVLCRGYKEEDHREFHFLNFEPNRGQMILFKSNDLVTDRTWNQSGHWVTPGTQSNQYLMGATYQRNNTSREPSPEDHQSLMKRWQSFIHPDYQTMDMNILDQPVGIRPVIRGQKIVASPHPHIPDIYIFNGFGSKGALRAPFFAQQLVAHILNKSPLDPSAIIHNYKSFSPDSI